MIREGKTDSLFYVHKDYLGSLLTFTGEDGSILHEQNFDAWGRYRNIVDGSYVNVPGRPRWLYRGYTGHEHLEQQGLDVGYFDLINMNARLYDPINGRMLSPDNFVHDGAGTQGYNRYTYAHNNPLKYSDPDGNNPILIGAAVGAAVFGFGNLAAHAIRGDVTSFGKGLKYFGEGAIAGAAVGALYGLGLGSGYRFARGLVKSIALVQAVTSAVSIVGGTISNGSQGLKNAGEIFLSNFYLDENKSFFGAVWEGISRHTYQVLQTTVAYAGSQFSNGIGKVKDVSYFGGATFSKTTWKGGSITLGNNIMLGGTSGRETNIVVGKGGYTFMHEYGHYIQSQKSGYAYLFKYGIGSAYWNYEWTEWDANQRASTYFNQSFNFQWNSNYYSGAEKRYSYLPGKVTNPKWYDYIPPFTFYSSLWR